MPTEDTIERVRQVLERGFCIIPVNRDKRPRFSIAAARRLAAMPHTRALLRPWEPR